MPNENLKKLLAGVPSADDAFLDLLDAERQAAAGKEFLFVLDSAAALTMCRVLLLGVENPNGLSKTGRDAALSIANCVEAMYRVNGMKLHAQALAAMIGTRGSFEAPAPILMSRRGPAGVV